MFIFNNFGHVFSLLCHCATFEKPLRDFLGHNSFERRFDCILHASSSGIKDFLNFGPRMLQVKEFLRIFVETFCCHFCTIDITRKFLLQYLHQILVSGQNFRQIVHHSLVSSVPKTFLSKIMKSKRVLFYKKQFSTFEATSKGILGNCRTTTL